MVGGHDSTDSKDLISQPTRVAPPEPNPPFVFPGFLESGPSEEKFPQPMPGPEHNARHTLHRNRRQLSINALPAFDFGGAASASIDTADPSPSPTRSIARKTPPPGHASGHRRGGSEFVGGNVSNPITASTSPVKGMDSTPPPAVPAGLGLGPPTNRRGHAHRRSGAVSQHDLSMILNLPTEGKAGSAPNTPSTHSFPRPSPPSLDRSSSQPTFTFPTEVCPQPSPKENDAMRSRVTFSGENEYIAPRPLSTISSETSSSVSTIRQNHSINDSITSIVSGTAASPPPSRTQRLSIESKDLEWGYPRKRIGDASSRRPAPPRNPSWPSMETEARHSSVAQADVGPDDTRPLSISQSVQLSDASKPSAYHEMQASNPSIGRPTQPFSRLAKHSPNSVPGVSLPESDEESKDVKRQKKTWGSRLSRKTKQQVQRAEASLHRPSTPPTSARDEDFSLDDVTFDEDTTYIIETPQAYPSGTAYAPPPFSEWDPRHSGSSFEGLDSPVLDIDAALNAPYDGQASTGWSNTKRRMHSSGETGGFSGPGMHYHRRAESAPELDFFEQSRLGFPRGGSNPAMAEAIEEEEEGEEEAAKDTEVPREQEPGLGVNIVETEHTHDIPSSRRPRYVASSQDQTRPQHRSTPESEHYYDTMPVEIVGADEEPRFSVITKSSDESTITPTLSAEPLPQRSVPALLDFSVQTPNLSLPETSSTVSSPDCRQASIDSHDAVRIHTANSSITDQGTLSSSRNGEFGLGSSDDVPSLTSSASTMISGHPTRFSSSANTTVSSADRSYSLSAAVPARTRPGSASKRSSLASLSRLVGSSYNKSKLNIAELAPPDSPERMERKKGKRISRLMFWKSKDKLNQT